MEWLEIVKAVIVWGSVIFIVCEITSTLHAFRQTCEAIQCWIREQLPGPEEDEEEDEDADAYDVN